MPSMSILSRKFVLVLLAATALSPRLILAQSAEIVEVTKQDFLALPRVVSTSLSTFGVQLGMTREQTMAALTLFSAQVKVRSVDEDLKQWSETIAKFGNTFGESPEQARTKFEAQRLFKIEVEDIADNGVLASISFERGIVSEIDWSAMRDFLVGKARELFIPEVYLPDSDLRLQLLGREDSMRQGVSPLGGEPSYTFLYEKEGLRLKGATCCGGIHFMTVILVAPSRAR